MKPSNTALPRSCCLQARLLSDFGLWILTSVWGRKDGKSDEESKSVSEQKAVNRQGSRKSRAEKRTAEIKQKEAQIAVLASKVEELTAKYAYLERVAARLEGVTIPPNVLAESGQGNQITGGARIELNSPSIKSNQHRRSRAPFRRVRSQPYRLDKTIDCARASHIFCAAGESGCCGLRLPSRSRPEWRRGRRKERRGRWAEPSCKGIMAPKGRSTGYGLGVSV